MVNALANWLGPWYTILGFVATIAALVVYFRKWLKAIRGEQEQTRRAAERAADSAGNAETAATGAEAHARTASSSAGSANDSSTQVEHALLMLAKELGDVKFQLADALEARDHEADVKEHLKERTDTLVGELLVEKARNRAPLTTPVPAYGNVGDTDAISITGRHRLHTNLIPTRQDDDFE